MYNDYPNQKDYGLIELENELEEKRERLGKLYKQIELLEEVEKLNKITDTDWDYQLMVDELKTRDVSRALTNIVELQQLIDHWDEDCEAYNNEVYEQLRRD